MSNVYWLLFDIQNSNRAPVDNIDECSQCDNQAATLTDQRRVDSRAQLATSLIESGVGALLILAVVSGFLWAPIDTANSTPELDQLAADTLYILDEDTSSNSSQTRLAAMCHSSSMSMSEQTLLRDRIETILPPTVFAEIKSPHGTIGPAAPVGGYTGRAVSVGNHCTVAIEIWYV